MLVEHLLLNLENKEDLEDLILQQEDDITPWNYEVTNENQDAASNHEKNKIKENITPWNYEVTDENLYATSNPANNKIPT